MLEDTLMTYVRCVINTTYGRSIRREDVVGQKAIKMRDNIMLELENQKLKLSADDDSRDTVSKNYKVYWVLRPMLIGSTTSKKKKFLKSMRQRGNLGLMKQEDFERERTELSKVIST